MHTSIYIQWRIGGYILWYTEGIMVLITDNIAHKRCADDKESRAILDKNGKIRTLVLDIR